MQFLLNPKDSVAGNLKNHLPAWQQFFAMIIFSHTSKASSVLDWIEHGVSLQLVHPRSEEQTEHPRFAKRYQLVEDLLTKTVGVQHVQSNLDCEHLSKCNLQIVCHVVMLWTLCCSRGMSCLQQVHLFLVSVNAGPALSMAWELLRITRASNV